MNENTLRSIIKAYSYRLCGTSVTVMISYLITGKLVVSFTIGATELVVKPLVYWIHERIWNKISWGRSS